MICSPVMFCCSRTKPPRPQCSHDGGRRRAIGVLGTVSGRLSRCVGSRRVVIVTVPCVLAGRTEAVALPKMRGNNDGLVVLAVGTRGVDRGGNGRTRRRVVRGHVGFLR